MFDPNQWFCGSQMLVPKGPPLGLVFFNTATGDGIVTPVYGRTYPRGVWTRINLLDKIPSDTKAIMVAGLLIITHGLASETSDLTINLKPPSSPENPLNYEGQVIEPFTGGGQRSPFFSVVGVENGEVDFWWNVQQLGTYPDYSSYGVNLTVQGIIR